jgi:hypothetical protein
MFGRARLGLFIVALAPVLAFIALAGFKFNVWSIEVGLDLLTLKVALGLAVLGVFGAMYAAAAGLAERRYAGGIGLAAVLLSAATVAGFGWHFLLARDAVGTGDVSTNLADPPAISTAWVKDHDVKASHEAAGCDLAFVPTQVAPEVAAYALKTARFDVDSLGVARADGTWISFWYNREYDASIRIRPGRTDVRVLAHDPAHDRGQACRLARRILKEMEPWSKPSPPSVPATS